MLNNRYCKFYFYMERSRNLSIDILKFFAVLLITNSHMEKVYADYGALSTGGAIGDALFFFCSGLHFSWAGWDVLMPGINEEYGVYILPYLALP